MSPARPLLVLVAILVGGYLMGQRVFAGSDPTSRVLLFLGAMAIFVVPLLLKSWRYTLVAAVIYMTFSGFLNHLAGYHTVTRSLKFALVAIVLFHWLVSEVLVRWREGKSLHYPLFFPIAVFASYSVLQMFNPNWSHLSNGLKAGLAGMVMHVLPMGLVFVGYDFVTERRQITAFLVLVVALTTFMAAFGIYQHQLGMEAVSSWGQSFGTTVERELTWGQSYQSVMKPLSFAQDAGAASSFYTLGILFTCILFLRPDLHGQQAVALSVAFVLLVVSLFLTQVRLGFVGACVGVCVLGIFGNRGRALFLFALIGGGFLITYFLYEPGVRDVLVHRYEILGSPVEAAVESRGVQADMIFVVARQTPFGAGIGRAGPGAYLGVEGERPLLLSPGENYYANLVIESGILGLLLMLLIFGTILRRAWDLYVRELVDPVDRIYCLGAACMLGVVMLAGMAGPVFYTTPMNVFFWFLTGLLFKLPSLAGTEGAGADALAKPEGPPGFRGIRPRPLPVGLHRFGPDPLPRRVGAARDDLRR